MLPSRSSTRHARLGRIRTCQRATAPALRACNSGSKASKASCSSTVTVQPLYTANDLPDGMVTELPGQAPYLRAGNGDAAGWQICQQVSEADAKQANDIVLAELEGGATALWLTVGGPCGVPADRLGEALTGVMLDLAPVVLGPDEDALAAAEAALAWAGESAAQLSLGIDPLGERMRRGASARPGMTPDPAAVAGLVGSGARVLVADASPVVEAAGSYAQQIAVATTAAIAYLRQLSDHGVAPAQGAAALDLRFAVTDDQFATIAMLRAARLVWAKVAETLELPADAPAPRQHAVTANTMMSHYDPWVNMLRTTVAGFAAGVGGADLVTLRPFDARIGKATSFSRRIARNTQSLLLLESHIGSVVDPGGGSFYIERYTADLAEVAWGLVQEIEKAGGLEAALASGLVAGWARDAWAATRADIARRKKPLTGVSEFPILDQDEVEREPLPVTEPVEDETALAPVVLGTDYERLRERVDAAGGPPPIPVVQLVSIATASARLGFVANALAAGGLHAVPVEPLTDPADLPAALAAASPEGANWPGDAGGIAVLAGRDPDYAEHGEAFVDALHEAGFDHVVVAGKASALPAADGSVAMGTNVVEFLSALHERVFGGQS
ncbi:MAG: methylmalonyl-CoA mutase [Micrococcales bacterium]|nr:MAG: methylmalonyl-CoA mutase [Micrococcales bacterium]